MSYIGKQPVVGNFQKCDAISVVNGQAAYSLTVGSAAVTPENANHMLVSLNGVLQAPGDSFTVSGSTLTFASNLATGDVIDFVIILGDVLDLGTPSDNSISTAKLVANAVTAAKFNADVISGQTELAATPADTDEFLISDAGVIKRIDFSHIKSDSGAYEKLLTTTVSTTSAVTFNSTYLTTTYRDYRIIISGLRPASDNVDFAFTVSTDNGSSYESSEYAYANAGGKSTNTNFQLRKSDSTSSILLNVGALGTGAGESYNAVIDLFDPLNQASDNYYFMIGGTVHHLTEEPATASSVLAGAVKRGASNAYNNVKFALASGNMDVGTFTLYGRKN